MSPERRCSDCGTYTTSPFGVCEHCQDKYKRVSGWCELHGPKFGQCDGCKMRRPPVSEARAS